MASNESMQRSSNKPEANQAASLTGGETRKEVAKEPVKEPVKEPAKELAKELAKDPAKESAKEPTNREEASRGRREGHEKTSKESKATLERRESRERRGSKERRESRERREPKESKAPTRESFREESRELKEPKEPKEPKSETKAPKEFVKEASVTNRANSGSSSLCNREAPANFKNNSGRTPASAGSADTGATRVQFTREAAVMSSGTASTASGNIANNENVTSGQTGNSVHSGTGGVKQRQPSLQQLPPQQINELKKSLQNPKPSALSGGQSNSSLTSEPAGGTTGGGQPATSNVNTSSSSKIVQQSQETGEQTKRRTSDCQLPKQFGDLSINKPSSKPTDKDSKPSPSKPTTTSSNTASTAAPLQATASIPPTNTQSTNTSKSANNKNTTTTSTTMPVLSADYFLNYQKEIERLKTRLEEERRKLNDVPCKFFGDSL